MSVVSEDAWNARIQVSDVILEFFESRNIYQSRTGENRSRFKEGYVARWKEGEIIALDKAAVVEPFSTIGSGHNLFILGSFGSIMLAFPTSAQIGRYCSVATGLKTIGFRHPVEAVSMSSAVFSPLREFVHGYMKAVEDRGGQSPEFNRVPNPQRQGPIRVGHDVWIGADVRLSSGVHTGDGAVVAAGATVTKDVPAYAVVGGTPAMAIKYRFDEGLRTALSATRW